MQIYMQSPLLAISNDFVCGPQR